MGPSDDTRTRLIDAGAEVFADVGFEKATVREICRRAGANVAAVNYHFGDKLGLFTEVLLQKSRFAQEAARASTVEGPPEMQLRAFIRAYLEGVLGWGKPESLVRLITTEMAHPSPALRKIVKQIVAPTEARVRQIVAEIAGLSPDDDRVRMCAHSIVGQCLHYRHTAAVLNILWPDLWRAPDRIDRLANHIADFSLAALTALKGEPDKPRRKHAGKA